MAADIHLDPERLRAHAARAELLADRLAGGVPTEAPPRLGARDGARLERIEAAVDRAARCLSGLAADLRAAAYRAEALDLAQRDLLREVHDGVGLRSERPGGE